MNLGSTLFRTRPNIGIRRFPITVWAVRTIQTIPRRSHAHPLNVSADHRPKHTHKLGFDVLLRPDPRIVESVFVEKFLRHPVQWQFDNLLPIPGFQNDLTT